MTSMRKIQPTIPLELCSLTNPVMRWASIFRHYRSKSCKHHHQSSARDLMSVALLSYRPRPCPWPWTFMKEKLSRCRQPGAHVSLEVRFPAPLVHGTRLMERRLIISISLSLSLSTVYFSHPPPYLPRYLRHWRTNPVERHGTHACCRQTFE